MAMEDSYDVLVIGGGVVGLTILRFATLKGWKCALVEAEPDLLTWASGSNSGIACTGVDASPGTLERALIRDSVSRVRPFCRDHNIPTRPRGSLVCQWPWDSTTEALQHVLQESHDAGDTHASILSAQQVQALEPNLSKNCRGAVHIPGEIVVDPWLFSIAYAVHARENGATIYTHWKFDPQKSFFDGNTWTAVRESSLSTDTGPSVLKAKTIVNATGLWSDEIQSKLHQNNPQQSAASSSNNQWTAKPRRGQYLLFQSTPRTRIVHPIQPVPTQRTKGIFVFSTLYDQIVVGPTALDQESKTNRQVDPTVAKELARYAQKIIAGLDPQASYVGSYVGIRPGTDKRDYQIHTSPALHYVAAAGIRSTGLTASLGIGRHICHLLGSFLSEPTTATIRTTPLPNVATLVQQYHQRGDQTVCIQGHIYKVTHPLTKFGWERQSGLADTHTAGNNVIMDASSKL
ncbi:L-2-hydroxyglutarate dehydrogenase, mitochondrial [Seminavis robusta]|uniref:L-2-hydroxyglutarate dehydrogenase, mitochondrial n=1 Tax=Seminavis robusta TaxID=568900 RepID=A0A9N8EKG9_9STRA|nr:L-2-hydroxyglutarate dehydrogenase, mitochondrial [Seminavis robusta]|eukprot:Sro1412_g270490.1 L-2-hydroxyglutarate dehydrogenase, mitochondrial (460) ;mRNA; f:19451-20945